METRAATAGWTDRCVGFDETPSGLVAVLARRRGRTVLFEPAEGPVEGAALAAGLAERESSVRRLPTPLRSRAKALAVLPGLLDAQLPYGIEECIAECVAVEAEGRSGGLTLTAAVVRREELKARLSRWAEAGREPHHVDQEGLALWTRAQDEHPFAGEGLRAAVYAGEDRAVLAFGRGGRLVSTHGLKVFEPAQAQRLARLVSEGSGAAVDWVWTGPLAEGRERVAAWSRAVGSSGEPVIAADPRFFLARAYAARALLPGPLRCDFRTGGFLHPAVARARGRGERFSALAWLAAGLILLAAGLFWQGATARRQRLADAVVRERTRSVLAKLGEKGEADYGYESRAAERAWAAARSRHEPFSLALSPFLSRALGRFLAEAREGKAVLHLLDWTEDSLLAEGRAPSPEAVERLLATASRETPLTVTATTEPAGEDGVVRFRLEGRRE